MQRQTYGLPSHLQGITARWLVPNYTAWWQRHMCAYNLPRVALTVGRPGFEPATCWLQVQRPGPPSHTNLFGAWEQFQSNVLPDTADDLCGWRPDSVPGLLGKNCHYCCWFYLPVSLLLGRGYNYDLTPIRRPFDCLSRFTRSARSQWRHTLVTSDGAERQATKWGLTETDRSVGLTDLMWGLYSPIYCSRQFNDYC